MTKWIIIIVIAVLAITLIICRSSYPRYRFCQTAKQFIVQGLNKGDYRVDGSEIFSAANGPWRVLSTSPYIVTQETGGGHLGSQGFIFSEDRLDAASLQPYFSESIAFQQLSEHLWQYHSLE